MISVVVTAGLVFARTAGMMVSMPITSTRGLPRHVPVLIALAVTMLVSPSVKLVPVPDGLGVLVLGLIGEIAVGLLLGSVISVVFGAFAVASEMMSMQMGLAMATQFNPLLRAQSGAIGTFATWMAALVYLGLGLHHTCLAIIADSFFALPPGTVGLPLAGTPVMVRAVGVSLSLGLQLAGPVLAMAWLVNLFSGILARLAPKMNVFFSMGMTLSSVLGLVLVGLSLPWMLVVHLAAVREAIRWSANLVSGLS